MRAKKGVPELKSNSKIQQMLRQWATSLKNKMNLTQYLGLYGNHYFQIYLFSAIPTQYAPQVVVRLGKAIVSPAYTNFGITNYTTDNQNYEIYLVLEGGDDGLQQKFTKQEISKIINDIESTKALNKNHTEVTSNITTSVEVKSDDVNTTKNIESNITKNSS